MAGIAIILVIGIYIMWKSIFRVKPKRKANSDKNTAVKLSDITLHKASEPIRKVDEGSACETYENSKTVAAKSDVHESHEFTVTNNEGSNSVTEIDAENMQEKDSMIPLGSLKTIDEPLVQEQFAKGAAASTSTVTFSHSFIFSGKTMIHSDINESNELLQAKSDTNVETQKLNLSVLTGEDSIDSLKSLKIISSDNSDTKSASSPTNTTTTITGSTNITTSLTFQIPDPTRFGSLKIIQSDTFASAAQSFAQTVVSTMTAKLRSASASSKLNEPVNAWTYVQPDKMPLISIDGVYIKDIRSENLMPTVEDKKKKSAPPQSGAAIITSNSTISATANTKSAGFTFNAPQLDGLTSYRTKPTTASTSRYLQSSSRLGENKSKSVFSRANLTPSSGQKKPTAAFSSATPTPSLGQNKSMPAFSFATPTPSLGQNKSTPAFSFATPTLSLGQNKSMAAFSFATPTPSLGQNKSTPAFSFATPTSSLEQSKPISVFGSATPASSTDFKLPESVPVVTSELKFGGQVSETVSNKKLRGNTLNPSPTITSSCNTPPMLNFTYRRAPTSTKETSNFFPQHRKIAKGLRRHECYGFFKRS